MALRTKLHQVSTCLKVSHLPGSCHSSPMLSSICSVSRQYFLVKYGAPPGGNKIQILRSANNTHTNWTVRKHRSSDIRYIVNFGFCLPTTNLQPSDAGRQFRPNLTWPRHESDGWRLDGSHPVRSVGPNPSPSSFVYVCLSPCDRAAFSRVCAWKR